MISGGDEIGHTQHGNNNAYCQDNEISWTPWELDAEQRDFLDFTRRLIRIWQRSSGAAPAQVLPGPPHPRRGRQRHRVARSVRAAR